MDHNRNKNLKKLFNDVSRHPSHQFEQENDLQDISGVYDMPFGMQASEYEDYFRQAVSFLLSEAGIELGGGATYMKQRLPLPIVKNSWEALKALNPVLDHVKMDEENGYDVYCAVMGVTSGFNIDDINFFLEQIHVDRGFAALQARNMPDHGPRLARIEGAAAGYMGWVASPKTAKAVEAQFKKKGLLP